MPSLIIVENVEDWPELVVEHAEVVDARDYLTLPRYVNMRRAKVFNLSRSYSYQSAGYYVSLLAEARGHRPMPSVTTIQDLRQSPVVRIVSEDLELHVDRALHRLKGDHFELSIYFGRNLASRYDRICQVLFNHFPAPLLRAEFVRGPTWRLHSIRPIAVKDVPESHRSFLGEQAKRFFARPRVGAKERFRYELAILTNPDEVDAPSDPEAIRRFIKAARKQGISATVIGKNDYGRLAEFDALFIRETTSVNHHTYRFANRAEAEGMVVIDDTESIVRCTNKVFQAEVFAKHDIACPKTLVLHKGNLDEVKKIGFPCVLKKPDSAFSAGVSKANADDFHDKVTALLSSSELVVAQEFLPSAFDWRVGVLGNEVIYVCQYHMAKGHWQIQVAQGEKGRRYGAVVQVPIAEAPEAVKELALRAAALMGNGLYGVDIKETHGKLYVMEVNDNPSIESGVEDKLQKDIYDSIIRYFLTHLERRGLSAPHHSSEMSK